MKKQPEATEKTRRKILEAFCVIYEKMPLEKIYVKDIIGLAGYNRSTFYQYFGDINMLLNDLENDVIQAIRLKMDERKDTAEQLMGFFEEKELYLKALLGPYGSIHFIDRLKQELNMEPPEVREEIKPYIVESYAAITVSLFRLWLARGKELSREELFYLIHTLYHSGYNGLTMESGSGLQDSL